jgi:hypothetical protein
MKIAILGGSPIALETALRFHLHGAALTWYLDQEDFVNFTSPDYPAGHYVSEIGLGVLRELETNFNPDHFNWDQWTSSYAGPLISYLKAHQEVKTDEVVSVTKRFLKSGEVIPDRSRFLDLFRVIFRVNPKEFIEDQKESNPDTYQRLTDEFIHSLASTIEMYQDYDLVLDLRSDMGRASVAASGRALGEGRECDKVSYGLKALSYAQSIEPSTDSREICLVGSDSLAAEILLSLKKWIDEPRSRLFIVSTEETPFEDFLEKADAGTKIKLRELFSQIDAEFEKEIEVFSTKLRDWQKLDDFVQVKIPKPSEPIPRINYFSGHNVSAIDELIDRKRMFLTLEKPEFQTGKKHPENNHLDLKTIGVDHILVGHGRRNPSVVMLDPDETGYFSLIPSRPNIDGGWENDLSLLEGIEDEIFKLFSPTDTH